MKKLFIFAFLLIMFVSIGNAQWKYESDDLGRFVGQRVKTSIQELREQGRLPYIRGQWYFVNPSQSANTASGKTQAKAFKELESAYSACTSGAGDGIAILSYGTTEANTAQYLSVEIEWAKHGITVFGVAAPSAISQRTFIADTTGVDSLPYLVNITGNNNTFYNLAFYNTPDDSLSGTDVAAHSAIKVTGGDYNAFISCNISCVPDDSTSSLSDLSLAGGTANCFYDCFIGNDTAPRATSSCNILFDTGVVNNIFDGCTTLLWVPNATDVSCVKSADNGSLTKHTFFKDCLFTAYNAGAGAVGVDAWILGTVPTNGCFIIDPNCMAAGFTVWDATGGNDRVIIPLGVTDGNTDPNIGGTP